MSHRLLIKDQQGVREAVLTDRIAVGRDPGCDVSPADPLMSRRHAEFVVVDGQVVVRDLKSRNGILVNGRRLLEAVLRPGDVVQIAHTAVTFLSTVDPITGEVVVAAEASPASAGDDHTALLTPGEVEAVARAAAARAEDLLHGGNGAKRAGPRLVTVVPEDDRTNIVRVPPPPPEAAAGAGPPSATTLGARTVTGPAVPAADVLLAVDHLPAPPPGIEPRRFPLLSVGAEILLLACLSFAAGVVSALLSLAPWMTHRVGERLALTVGAAFVFVVVAALLVVVTIRNVFLSRG